MFFALLFHYETGFLTSYNLPNDYKCTSAVWDIAQLDSPEILLKLFSFIIIFVYVRCTCGHKCMNGSQRTILWRIFSCFTRIWAPGTEVGSSGFWDKCYAFTGHLFLHMWTAVVFSTPSAAVICISTLESPTFLLSTFSLRGLFTKLSKAGLIQFLLKWPLLDTHN